MPDHERDGRPLLLGKGQELRRKIAKSVAIKCNIVRGPEAVEDREQHQRVFRRFSERFSCSISRRARSTAALVSGAAYPLTCMSGVMSAT